MKKVIAAIVMGAVSFAAFTEATLHPLKAKPETNRRAAAPTADRAGYPVYAPTNPAHRSDGSDETAWLLEPLRYEIGNTGVVLEVPDGFVTDFASIPQAFWSLGLTPRGRYSRAAIIHDYLYWSQTCTKEQADHLMVLAMKESNVKGVQRDVIQLGLFIGAQGAWDGNKKEREQLLPRIIPAAQRNPADPNMSWAELRAQLKASGVQDPAFPSEPPYCIYGNSTDVPIDKSRQYTPSPITPVLAKMNSGMAGFRLTPFVTPNGAKPDKYQPLGIAPFIQRPKTWKQ